MNKQVLTAGSIDVTGVVNGSYLIQWRLVLLKGQRTLIFLLFLLSGPAFSAPIPATSSSSFLGIDKGLFWSRYGFSIHAGQTFWSHALPSEDNKFIETLYKAPQSKDGVQASLTVRVDQLKKRMTLKKYVNRWKRDYPRFGFNILSARKVRVGKEKIFLLDMVNPNTNRQLRQYILVRRKQAVILTCRDHTKNFLSSVGSCNRIVQNFSWSS